MSRQEDRLKAIADAIRVQEGSTQPIPAADFVSRILALPTPPRVFGVSCDTTSSATTLTRLTAASDPNGYVTTDITTEPVAAVGAGAGSSPFDAFMPWRGMEEYNVENGTITAKRGDSGFSRTEKDTVVKIPEFWHKTFSVDTTQYFYVSDKELPGFFKHPGSGCYVGKYNAGGGYVSRSGLTPLNSTLFADDRTNAMAKGVGWQLYDFAAHCAISLLYLVEFSCWDSQSMIGQGNTNAGTLLSTGGTDTMKYHTGRADGENGLTQVQYRGIEDLWGNVFDRVDGFNANNKNVYVCTDPSMYQCDTMEGYTLVGKLPFSGMIKKMNIPATTDTNNWALIAELNGGANDTYIPDQVYSGVGWKVLRNGGYKNVQLKAGLFCLGAVAVSAAAEAETSPRLLFRPQ